MRILILGGTREARELAGALTARHHTVTTSLAGRTSQPDRPPGRVITGGFGGAEGLADYIERARIDYLIDATHPFAAQISANAVAAAEATDIELLRLRRPAWPVPEPNAWVEAENAQAAAGVLPPGATVFLTVGRQGLAPFLARKDCRFLLRSIEPPEEQLPGFVTAIEGRPPFSRNDELALMRRRRITHLVTKNAGGRDTYAKIEAAFILKIRVIMIERPALPKAPEVGSVAAAMEILSQLPAPKRFVFF
ncbi:cobalt-precorrin-6A reductase [Cucumibacter marinus]|uniref:cobalt-precorrin-6A reductase n=1 Tax=Cucumibacter marinus TaxID=1121252 RepID=UPI0004297B35|nr:cobalt-precorrin-6A reductase [Cucumibacter marinus]